MTRSILHRSEKELSRMHLKEYGANDRAPILLQESDVEGLEPDIQTLCAEIVDKINRQLLDSEWSLVPRMIMLTGDGYPDRNQEAAFDHLRRIRKIQAFLSRGGHGMRVQA